MKYVELWLRRKRTITRLLIAGLIIAFTCEVYYFFSYWFSKEELREHYEMCDKFPSEFIQELSETGEERTWESIEEALSARFPLENGGKWSQSQTASNRTNNRRVAIVVPYRDRFKNLKIFVQYMHDFLIRQAFVNYAIYLVEPMENLTFNRALLINIGFTEALKDEAGEPFDCFVFHDIDMVPINDENLYVCDPEYPKQFAISISIYAYSEIDYFRNRYMGGVTAFTREQFTKINGLSNLFYGWGGEDDDVYKRCMKYFGKITRLKPDIGRYFANCHEKDEHENTIRYELLKNSDARMKQDGLNSLDYRVLKVFKNKLFTLFHVYYQKNSQVLS